MKNDNIFNRRDFISRTAIGGIGALGTITLFNSCSGSRRKEISSPPDQAPAPDGKLIKAGLVGCGKGAALNFLDAGPNLQITVLGDVFQDKIDHYFRPAHLEAAVNARKHVFYGKTMCG